MVKPIDRVGLMSITSTRMAGRLGLSSRSGWAYWTAHLNICFKKSGLHTQSHRQKGSRGETAGFHGKVAPDSASTKGPRPARVQGAQARGWHACTGTTQQSQAADPCAAQAARWALLPCPRGGRLGLRRLVNSATRLGRCTGMSAFTRTWYSFAGAAAAHTAARRLAHCRRGSWQRRASAYRLGDGDAAPRPRVWKASVCAAAIGCAKKEDCSVTTPPPHHLRAAGSCSYALFQTAAWRRAQLLLTP